MKRFLLLLCSLYLLTASALFASRLVGQMNPSGGLIAYTLSERGMASGSSVMFIDPFTGISINASIGLATEVNSTREPRWSPDGNELSFRVYRDRQSPPQNYALRVADNTYVNLSEAAPFQSLPIYGADNQILYSTNPLFGTGVLYRVSNDTPAGETIANVQTASRDLPVWSPDGTRVAYLSEYRELETDTQPSSGSDVQEIDIYVYDVTTGETINYTLDLATHGQLAWSPDGHTIAFISRARNVGQIYLLDVETGDITELPPRTNAVGRPVWSSDNRMLAFTTENREDISNVFSDVMIIDLETQAVTNISQSTAFDNQPIWSPDNRYLAFISMRDGQSELYMANIQTGNLRRITHTEANEADITWQPRP